MAHDPMTVLHVDMDAFYASVEQRDRPELRGRPVIVGGTGGRGVVCAASYEARPFGVHSAMPTATARRLCPHAVFLPVRMGHYADVARQIREVFMSFTPLVEPLSLDEAFLDVRGCEGLFGPAPEIALQVKARILAETGLVASVGVAPNKFLAKLASDHGKPDGFVVLPADRVAEFLAPLPVGQIWGVGAKGQEQLHALGARTVGQLAGLPERLLADHLGEAGRHVWRLAHGLDDRPVVSDREAKSISTETTFDKDIGDRRVLRVWLLGLVDHLAGRLRQQGVRAQAVELKVRSSDFRTRVRSLTLAEPSNLTGALWQAAQRLLDRSLSRDVLPVRLVGVGASKLTRGAAVQKDLFDSDALERQAALDETIDAIRGQFGSGAIRWGSLLDGPHASPGDQA
ncbi:MAG TPA: DNA polymerase IV [Gemmataceae bacterium]|jgi:DNA polymerase-4|nr:DNA polymerase IV [Gemmataceae bacterium]